MNDPGVVTVRELAAWSFDEYAYRSIPAAACGEAMMERRPAYVQHPAILEKETSDHEVLLRRHATRTDLLFEMRGLEWSLGIVDLRHLLSFQRRLAFDFQVPELKIPSAEDWPALINLAFGPPKAIDCNVNVVRKTTTTVTLQSCDPNLQFQISSSAPQPLTLYAGSPFLEVASFRGRWFLRDGYHRAYALLRQGILAVPAVVVQARTLAELGATRPWFFPENVLFSEHPPLVTDFLDDRVNIEYTRPRLLKTLRVTVEESFIPTPDLSTETSVLQETSHEHFNQTR